MALRHWVGAFDSAVKLPSRLLGAEGDWERWLKAWKLTPGRGFMAAFESRSPYFAETWLLASNRGCPLQIALFHRDFAGNLGCPDFAPLMKVKGIGCGYWRAVGTAEEMIQKAKDMGQNWLCGMGMARLIQR